MTLRDLARTILSESLLPLTARQVWDEAVKRGLDKKGTISLVNGEQLVKLLEQYKVGVSSTPIEILEFDPDADLFGNEKE